MRNKQVFKNLWGNLILQLITAVSGLVLPRLFIAAYGSTVNGMISSVGQFLAYLNLVEAGISAAAIVELYAPLNQNDTAKINSVLSAIRHFYYRSGFAYLILLVLLTVFYPLFVKGQVDDLSTRIFILVLACSNLVDYFFVGKYRVLLVADQRGYIISLAQTVGTLLNLFASMILIQCGSGFLLVKTVATFLYISRIIYIYYYVRKHYKFLNFRTSYPNGLLNQRWAALLHQIVGVVVNNTDLVILTLFMGSNSLSEISVYSVYNMVAMALTALLGIFSNGVSSSFGSILFSDQDENDTLKNAYSNYEYLYMLVLFCVYACDAVLLCSFVKIYTAGITDAVYVRYYIAMLFVALGFLQNVRIPSLTIICAAGHFKETKYRAILEAVINIVVSLLLVKPYGMAGILIGTICSYLYRSADCILYNSKYIVKGTLLKTIRRIVRNLVITLAYIILVNKLLVIDPAGFIGWFGYAVITAIGGGLLLVIVNGVAEPAQMKQLFERCKNVLKRA